MSPSRMREIIAATDAYITRAIDFVGTDNAPAEELAAIARLHEAQATGPVSGVVLALAEVGRLQGCPPAFWRDVRRAAHLTGVALPASPDADL